MMRRQGNYPPHRKRLIALVGFLLFLAAFASFLLLSSASSTTTNAQQTFAKFKAVSANWQTLCAIRDAPGTTDDGKLKCWGDPLYGGKRIPTDGGYVSIDSTGPFVPQGCAVKSDGSASCWDDQKSVRPFTPDPQLKYSRIAVASEHTCWLLKGGQIGCIANPAFTLTTGADEVPVEIASFKFSEVVVGSTHSCAVIKDSAPSTSTEEDKGTVKCWGDNLYGQTTPPLDVKFKSIASGKYHNCGIVDASGTEDHETVRCWGLHEDGRTAPPLGTFKSLTGGRFFTCGIKTDDTIACWGNNHFNQSAPPLGRYSAIDAAFGEIGINATEYACAIAIDTDPNTTGDQNTGALNCWGGMTAINRTGYPYVPYNTDTSVPTPVLPAPTATATPSRDVLSQVSAGVLVTCVLTDANEVKCFGRNALGEADPPDGIRLDNISVGRWHACGISHYGRFGKRPENTTGYWLPPDSNVVCWGDDRWGQSTPPKGSFTTVSAGFFSSCGLKSDGAVACWGRNQPPNYSLISGVPTSGMFVDVKVGHYINDEHACALSNTGSVTCWGSNVYKQTEVPSGIAFKAISVGGGTSCGIVQDSDTSNQTADEDEDTVRCWGTGREHAEDDLRSSIKNFPSTVKLTEIVTEHTATCGILKEDYQNLRTTPYEAEEQVYSTVNRKANTPYCKGELRVFNQSSDLYYSTKPWDRFWPKYRYRYYFPHCSDGTSVFGCASNKLVTYRGISSSGDHTCAIRSDGRLVCDGPVQDQWIFGNVSIPPIATVAPAKAQPTYTCGSDTYNGASPIDGGRFPTSGGNYYVSIPAGALANNAIIGVQMTEGADATTLPVQGSGHEFRGKLYSVTVKNSDCSDPSAAISTTRWVDVCIPKPADRSGRWWDWQMYEVTNQSGTLTVSANPAQGFTDLGELVCAEFKKLPVIVAAASKPIPTPIANVHTPTPTPTYTPTPTATATPVLYDGANDVVDEQNLGISKSGINDAYVRVPKMAIEKALTDNNIPSTDTAVLKVKQVFPSEEERLVLDNIYRVGDLYVEINLVTFNPVTKIIGVDIGDNLNPPAEICIVAPAGTEKKIYHRGDNATKWNELPHLDPSLLNSQYSVKYGTGDYACGLSDSLSTFVASALRATPTPTPTPMAFPKILRITPNATNITLSAEERVRISVDVYGVQDIVDNSLANDVTFEWSVEPSGGGFREAERDADADDKVNDREVLFTTPSQPGRYTVKAELDRFECGDDDGLDDGCFAEIEVTVRRAAAPPSPTAIPANPAGEIPSVIVDDDGNQYEVFTPEEGGRFEGNGVSVVAEPGAVPNREIIGVRADTDGEASNVGQIQDRVTLAGSYYGIYAVDASGQALNGYLLDDPITVCLPVPSRFTSNISQLAMVSERSDGTFATLSSSIRLSTSGVLICGGLSELSARLAVGTPRLARCASKPDTPADTRRTRHRRHQPIHQRNHPFADARGGARLRLA